MAQRTRNRRDLFSNRGRDRAFSRDHFDRRTGWHRSARRYIEPRLLFSRRQSRYSLRQRTTRAVFSPLSASFSRPTNYSGVFPSTADDVCVAGNDAIARKLISASSTKTILSSISSTASEGFSG